MDKEPTVPKMGADIPAENTPNASKNLSPKCLLKPKSLRFEKSSLWVSVVRGMAEQYTFTCVSPRSHNSSTILQWTVLTYFISFISFPTYLLKSVQI